MQVADQLGQLVISRNQAGRELVRVAGGVAQALNTRNVAHILQQRRKVRHLAAGAGAHHRRAVGVDVLTQERDFFHTLVGQTGDFDQHVFKRAADFFAARVGHHAVAAVFRAAFHDAHKGRGAFHLGRGQVVKFLDFRKADVHLRAAL